MRTGRTFEVVHIVTKSVAFASEAAVPPNYQHHPSPSSAATTGWKSPVPYLFGGMAAMLGLIAFALLILACSYWKLSGNFDSGENSGDDADDEKVKVAETKAMVYENSILVIMAGEEKPTFLAMPAAGGRTSSFGDGLGGPSCSCTCSSSSSNNSSDELDERENDKVVMTTVITDGGAEKRLYGV